MRPLFKKNLISVREEQQGVVYYRIDDPSTRTSFKLYEIEYLIAQKCDGTHDVGALVGLVKRDLNFGVTEDDLKKFIKQMQAMGFMSVVLEEPLSSVSSAAPASTVSAELNPVQEIDRLMREAVACIQRRNIAQVRDYIAKARVLAPQDERLRTLLGHAQLVSSSDDAEYHTLLEWVQRLFPHLDSEESTQPSFTPPTPQPVLEDERTNVSDVYTVSSVQKRSKKALFVGLFAFSVAVFLGVAWYLRWFETPVWVSVISLKAARAPAVYSGAAQQLTARQEAWLAFQKDGTIAFVPAVGDAVKKDTLLASLHMPEDIFKNLEKTTAAHQKATQKKTALQHALDPLEQQRTTLIEQVNAAQAEIKKLLSATSSKNKTLVAKKKADVARYHKTLASLAVKKQPLQKALAQAEKTLAQTRAALDAANLQAQPYRIYAPFDGTVMQVNAQAEAMLSADTKTLFLADITSTRVRFSSNDKSSLQTGGVVQVLLPGSPPLQGTVETNNAESVWIDIADPTHTLRTRKPEEFFLVREFVEGAFSVPKSAVLHNAQKKPFVWLYNNKEETVTPVNIEPLSEDNTFLRVRDPSGVLQDLKQVVIHCAQPCTSIQNIQQEQWVRIGPER
jgi:hypothetical protein